MVSEEELYLLSTSLRRNTANPAQWKNDKIRSHPEAPALKRTKSLMSGECGEVLSACTRGTHCRKRHCNCDHGESMSTLLESATPPAPSVTSPETLILETLPIIPDLSNQCLEVILGNLTSDENDMYTDLMHSIVDSSLQDLLREEMDEGHRPVEPTPPVLDLMSNTWEDIFQNPFDYMLNAMDSCPNCGRQITLSRMAPHIVNRCGESRLTDDRGKRRAKRDRQKDRVSPLRSSRPREGGSFVESTNQAAVVSPALLNKFSGAEDQTTSPVCSGSPLVNGCRSVEGRTGTVAGLRIASISEKLLRSKRRVSSTPIRILPRGFGGSTKAGDITGNEIEETDVTSDNG